MARRIVVVGGGAAGIGAAGAAKGADPAAEVVVYTEFEDVAYSPCGIPYVHGKEIPSFERAVPRHKEEYVDAGIDIHYRPRSRGSTSARKTVQVAGEGAVPLRPARHRDRLRVRRPGRPGR